MVSVVRNAFNFNKPVAGLHLLGLYPTNLARFKTLEDLVAVSRIFSLVVNW